MALPIKRRVHFAKEISSTIAIGEDGDTMNANVAGGLFRFLDLPPELRLYIYKEYCLKYFERRCLKLSVRCQDGHLAIQLPPLALVNRITRKEFMPFVRESAR